MEIQSAYTIARLEAWWKGTNMPATGTRYIAPANNGTELSGNFANGRVAVTFGAAASRESAISADVNWGAATGNQAVNEFQLWDAASGGNLIVSDNLRDSNSDPISVTVNDGNEGIVNAGGIIVSSPNRDYAEALDNEVINWMVGNGNVRNAPAQLHLGAFNGGTEVSSTISTGRQAFAFTGSGTMTTTPALIEFGNVLGAASLDNVRILDAATVGNVLLIRTVTGQSLTTQDKYSVTLTLQHAEA